MASEPNTVRAALIAQLMGEMDDLFTKADAVAAKLTAAQDATALSIQSLADAGDKYRLAVTQFTEETRKELSEFLERKAAAVQKQNVSDIRTAMDEAARSSFRSEAADKATDLAKALASAAREFRQSRWQRLGEIAIVSAVASALTAIIVWALLVR